MRQHETSRKNNNRRTHRAELCTVEQQQKWEEAPSIIMTKRREIGFLTDFVFPLTKAFFAPQYVYSFFIGESERGDDDVWMSLQGPDT